MGVKDDEQIGFHKSGPHPHTYVRRDIVALSNYVLWGLHQ